MVYKGCEKKMILIKNPKNSYFDEVYFILKDKPDVKGKDCDMIGEANRIINENMIYTPHRGGKPSKKLLKNELIISFAAGVICGIIATLMSYYIL